MVVCKGHFMYPSLWQNLQESRVNGCLTLTGCTGPCRWETPSVSLKYLGLWWFWVSAGSKPSPAVCLEQGKKCDVKNLESLLLFSWKRKHTAHSLPYSRPFSVSLTFTPGLVLKVTGIKATRASQQHRNILTGGRWKRQQNNNNIYNYIFLLTWYHKPGNVSAFVWLTCLLFSNLKSIKASFFIST